jgi:hypothetical protein
MQIGPVEVLSHDTDGPGSEVRADSEAMRCDDVYEDGGRRCLLTYLR